MHVLVHVGDVKRTKIQILVHQKERLQSKMEDVIHHNISHILSLWYVKYYYIISDGYRVA